MKKIICVLCFAITAGCVLLPTGKNDGPSILVASLKNSDISWDGNFIGLQPTVKSETVKRLLGFGKQAVPALQTALSDSNKFAAAHVLLTQIKKKQYQISASHWNGLEVDLHADGTIDLHPEQMDKIKALWKEEQRGS